LTIKHGFRFDLSDEYNKLFEIIKQNNNFQSNVEVFRYCLKTVYELEMQINSPYSVLPKTMEKEVTQKLKRSDVQKFFKIYSIDDFIRKGTEALLLEIDNYLKKRSILHWDVRSRLIGSQKEVSLAIRELYLENKTGDFTFKEIRDKLNMHREELKSILNEFVTLGMLDYDEKIELYCAILD
jgi:Fic family protein